VSAATAPPTAFCSHPEILQCLSSSRTLLIPAFGEARLDSNIAAQEIGVDSILSWTQDAFVDPGAPRTGRELQVFHLATAFLPEASVNAADCDVHFELSQSRNDLGTPPAIVTIPEDSHVCAVS